MDTKQWLQDAAVTVTAPSDNTFIVTPTAQTPYPESFYFNFSRDIVGFDSQFKCSLVEPSSAKITFEDEQKLSENEKEVLAALREFSN